MAFNINEFRSEMTFDGARPNLFEVFVNMPAAGFAGGLEVTRKLTFMGRSAQLPGSTIGVVPMPYFGRTLNFAGNRTFADWTITVINDEDFTVRNAVERWMNAINSHRGNVRNPAALRNTGPGGAGGYTADAEVIQYSKLGSGGVGGTVGIKKYKLIGIFPVDLSPIDLDWANNDSIEEFSITFSMQWWECTDLSGVPAGSNTTT